MGVGIKDEKGLGHFVRLGPLVVAVAAHLPLAEAWRAMRVDGQQFFRVIARGPADASSLATKGSPLANSKPRWLSERCCRSPVEHSADSWIICSASRGSTRPPHWPLQPQSKSQVPSRRCSGIKSHRPTRLPDHLTDHFRCASIMGLWSTLVALQCLRTLFEKSGAQLKVALLAEAELRGGLKRTRSFALALDEHCQLAGDLIIGTDLQRSARAYQGLGFQIELRHDCILRNGRWIGNPRQCEPWHPE